MNQVNRAVKVLLILLISIIVLVMFYFAAVWLRLINFPFNADLALGILVEIITLVTAAIYLKYTKP